MKEKPGDKHHYIPKFYLKQWVRPDGPKGLICEFSKPYKKVVPRITHPDGTGYVRGLYTFDRLAPELADAIEKQVLQLADDDAALLLRRFLSAAQASLNADERSAWSRFLMTLMHRNPEGLENIRVSVLRDFPTALESIRMALAQRPSTTDPVSRDVYLEEQIAVGVQNIVQGVLQTSMDNRQIGEVLNRMEWGVISINRACFPLLTSDRPIVMSNGIGKADGYLMLPINPRCLFVAAGSREKRGQIAEYDMQGKLAGMINDRVARQARKYIYATDDSQLRFVANRLGEKMPWSPLELGFRHLAPY